MLACAPVQSRCGLAVEVWGCGDVGVRCYYNCTCIRERARLWDFFSSVRMFLKCV